jgi:ribonucleoside-diphosphate reductase beta chain
MQELLVPAMGVVNHTFEEFEGEEPPFAVDLNELAEYAMDKVGRRLRAIESARGADLRSVDVDVTPEQLEERFHAEDLASQPFAVA